MKKEERDCNIQVQKYELDNGVRVILIPDNSVTTVFAQITVEVGASCETRDNNGISHFLEHILCSGTKKRPSNFLINEEIESTGGFMGAVTNYFLTKYIAKTTSRHSSLAVDLIADCYLNSLIKSDAVEKEKEPILQEIAIYDDSPEDKVYTIFRKLVYGDKPMGRDICGTRDVVENMTRAVLVEYIEKTYLPEATVVTVAGNFDVTVTKLQIKGSFNKMTLKQKKVWTDESFEKETPRSILVYRGTEQTKLILGVRFIDTLNARKEILEILNIILHKRIFQKVRGEAGLAYDVQAKSALGINTGLFFVSAGIRPENLMEAVRLILLEIKKVSSEKICSHELMTAKTQAEGELLISLDTVEGRAGYFTAQEILFKRIDPLEEVLEKYNRVTAEDILLFAKEVFQPDNLKLAVVGPHEDLNSVEKLLADF